MTRSSRRPTGLTSGHRERTDTITRWRRLTPPSVKRPNVELSDRPVVVPAVNRPSHSHGMQGRERPQK